MPGTPVSYPHLVLGGGGDVRAAGCTLEGTDEQAAAQMLEAIRRTVPGIA